MVAIPAFSDFLFVSAAALNNASSVVASGVEDITGSLFTTGIVNSPALVFSPSSLVVTVTFGPSVRCIFSSGVMAGGFGNTNGVIDGVYSVNMAPLVPGTGSVTTYITASPSQIGQQSTLITGPSPGHPDYDPTFVPYTAYLETLDTLTLTATTTPPDNSTNIELCRVILTAGESSISSVTTTYQINSTAISTVFTSGFGSLSASTTIGSKYAGQFINVSGSNPTLALVAPSTVPGMSVGFIATTAFTLTTSGGTFIGGTLSAKTSIVISTYRQYIAIQSDGVNWRVITAHPALVASGLFLNIQKFTSAGTFTYTPTVGTNKIIVKAQAGGGGSAGAPAAGSGNAAAGECGNGGAYGEAQFSSNFSGGTVVVGLGGSAGVPNIANGGNGGNSSFTPTSGTALVCPGGPGGTQGPVESGSASGGNGLTSGLPTGANIVGRQGGIGVLSFGFTTGQVSQGGSGGNAGDGGGGGAQSTSANFDAVAAASPGSGASGCMGTNNTGTLNGAAGAAGYVIIYEYS